MLSYLKKLLYVFGVTFSLAFAYYIYEEIASDFRYENIVFENLQKNHNHEISPLPAEKQELINQILNQSFTYIGKGHQAFVFESDDGQYVLKFFRFRRLKPSLIVDIGSYFPGIGDYFIRQEKKRLRRIEKLFTGYQVAYEYDPKNTGLLFIHFNNTDSLKKQIRVTDRFGFKHRIDLDSVYFAIQQRAYTSKKILETHLKNGEIEIVKQRLRQLFDLYVDEYRHGIYDQDRNILHNTGFAGEQPMRLDIGQLKKDDAFKDPVVYMQDLNKIADKRIAVWLRKHYPNVAEEIIADLNVKLEEI